MDRSGSNSAVGCLGCLHLTKFVEVEVRNLLGRLMLICRRSLGPGFVPDRDILQHIKGWRVRLIRKRSDTYKRENKRDMCAKTPCRYDSTQ